MNIAASSPTNAGSARSRVLETATRLFYAEGIHAVGIDRIIAEARVAKATFYNHFPSKDELVRAYIEEQDRLGRVAIENLPELPPREMLFAIFDRIGEAARQPGYRGCPFLNATAEYPDSANPVRKAVEDHRRWFRERLRGILAADGNRNTDRTANMLVALWDGLLISAHVDGAKEISALTRDAVARAINAAL